MFSKLFGKKQEYSNSLNEERDCDHCESSYKLKKCHDCKERKICKMCFKTEKLCISCNETYEEWANKVKDVCNKAEKQAKYGYVNEECAGSLIVNV